MTFYSNEVTRKTKELYPHDDLTRKIIRSRDFIEKNIQEAINLDIMAAEAHVSKFHFIRVFKKYYGRTPNQYLQEQRITKAKKLLKAGNSIEKTCYAVGFNSKTSFTSLFRKITGVTPLVYKKAILKNND